MLRVCVPQPNVWEQWVGEWEVGVNSGGVGVSDVELGRRSESELRWRFWEFEVRRSPSELYS